MTALLYRLPPSLRVYLKTILRTLKDIYRWLAIVFKDFRMSVRQIQSHGVKIVFIGQEPVIPFLVYNLLGSPLDTVYVKDISIWSLRNEVNRLSLKADMLIVSANPIFLFFLKRKRSFVIPNVVEQRRTVLKHSSDSWEQIFADLDGAFNKQAKKKLRNKIVKNGFYYEINHDISLFPFFYNDCYLPTAKTRHRVKMIKSYSEVMGKFMEGEFLLVKRNKDILAIGVNQKIDSIYRNMFLGIANGEISLFREGIAEILYLFSYCEAVKKGCRELDFGGSRPFLNDGVLQYKKKWGARVEKYKSVTRSSRLIICNNRIETQQLLMKNPFIHIRNGNLHGIVFFDEKIQMSDKELYELFNKSYHPGLLSIEICFMGKEVTAIADRIKTISHDFPIPIETVCYNFQAT